MIALTAHIHGIPTKEAAAEIDKAFNDLISNRSAERLRKKPAPA